MATYSQVCSAVGSFGYASRFTLYVVLTNRNGDPATNKSVVDYNVYFENTSGGGTFTSNTRLYFALNGGVIKDSTSSITGPRNGQVSIASGSITVDHNNDGTKAIGFHALVQGVSFGIKGEISGTFTLNTIPRASSVSGGSGNIGGTTTITISRASTNFTHTLRYVFGTLNNTIATGVGTSYTWTIPTSFYAQIPNDKNGVGAIYCDTYSGSTLVGTKSVSFTATVTESSSRPTVSATLTDTNATTKALTGNASKMVKGKSTGQLIITSTARNSATIKSVTINGENVGSATSITKNYANISTASFTIITTDSRGYTNTSYVLNPTYVNYVPLTLSATIFRPQPTGTEIQMTYSGNYFNASFGAVANTLSITWKYKVKGASSWTNGGTITPTLSGNTITSKTISLGTNYNYQTAYEFQITAVDKLTTITQTIPISVGTPVFNWGKDFFNVNCLARLKKNLALIGFFAREGHNSKSFLYLLDAMNVSGRYYKLASIPATNDANAIQLNIKGYMGNWTGAKVTIDLQISNRESLRVYGNYIGHSGAFNCQRIVIYKESDGSHTVYLHNVSGFTGPNAFNITCGSYGGVYATITNDYSYTTAPTGTLVYSSTTSTMGNANGAVVLFDNTSGTRGAITLSETAANFSYLEIFYGTSSTTYAVAEKLDAPNGKNCRIAWAGSTYSYYKDLVISGTSITNLAVGRVAFKDGAYDTSEDGANVIYIRKIIGYR